nr:MAG TPA: hypothetical protein [Caudoviricetes sp.]
MEVSGVEPLSCSLIIIRIKFKSVDYWTARPNNLGSELFKCFLMRYNLYRG